MTLGDSNTPAEFASVDTDDYNNIKTAAPGELQSVMDGLSGGFNQDLVILEPNATYSTGSGYTQPKSVSVFLNGARIEPSADVDLWTMEARTQLMGPGLLYTNGFSGYTSKTLHIDAPGAGEHIRLQSHTQAHITDNVQLWGTQGEGDGLYVSSASSSTTVYFNRWDVSTQGFNRAVVLDAGAPINGNVLSGDFKNYSKGIVHIGSDNAQSLVSGSLQPNSSSTHGIQNQTTNSSVAFKGYLWDSTLHTTAPLDGPNIRIDSESRNLPGNFTFGTGTTINGVSYQSLAGSAPDATNYWIGDMVRDTDNAGDVYLVYDPSVSSGVTQIGT